jgi:hypothetical protein
MIYTYAIIKTLNRQIIDEHYLIIHTFSGATAHSSCVAEGVALLPIHMRCGRPHGATGQLTARSSLKSLLD